MNKQAAEQVENLLADIADDAQEAATSLFFVDMEEVRVHIDRIRMACSKLHETVEEVSK